MNGSLNKRKNQFLPYNSRDCMALNKLMKILNFRFVLVVWVDVKNTLNDCPNHQFWHRQRNHLTSVENSWCHNEQEHHHRHRNKHSYYQPLWMRHLIKYSKNIQFFIHELRNNWHWKFHGKTHKKFGMIEWLLQLWTNSDEIFSTNIIVIRL